MKRLIIAILLLLALCGCEDDSNLYPRVLYQRSYWALSTIIPLGDGYTIDQGHTYDIIDTEQGYDLVLHFVEVSSDG